MYKSVLVRLPFDRDLVDTIEEYNDCCNDTLKIAYKKKLRDKMRIHDATYRKMRRKHKILNSCLLQASRDQAYEMLKQCKSRTLPIKKTYSSIRYDKRTISFKMNKREVSISTINGRKKYQFYVPEYFEQYMDYTVEAATLKYHNDNLMMMLNCHKESPKLRKTIKVIGVDRGIRNQAVLSDGTFYNNRKLNFKKKQYQYLRSQLQQIGTRSAKRKLKKASGREQRFVKDVNHQISKSIANSKATVIAIENLKIGRSKKKGKALNRSLNRWSFGQFRQFLAYKLEALGKHLIEVDARYTSQRCSKCGHTEKDNRKESRFKCMKCGFDLDADLNASRNIAHLGKSHMRRLKDHPAECNSDIRIASYKPPISIGGR